jgi:excisionase family DNA binding protein
LSKIISTKNAAEMLNISERYVRRLIVEEKLPAERVGRSWIIQEADLHKLKRKPPGRPKPEA